MINRHCLLWLWSGLFLFKKSRQSLEALLPGKNPVPVPTPPGPIPTPPGPIPAPGGTYTPGNTHNRKDQKLITNMCDTG